MGAGEVGGAQDTATGSGAVRGLIGAAHAHKGTGGERDAQKESGERAKKPHDVVQLVIAMAWNGRIGVLYLA